MIMQALIFGMCFGVIVSVIPLVSICVNRANKLQNQIDDLKRELEEMKRKQFDQQHE